MLEPESGVEILYRNRLSESKLESGVGSVQVSDSNNGIDIGCMFSADLATV